MMNTASAGRTRLKKLAKQFNYSTKSTSNIRIELQEEINLAPYPRFKSKPGRKAAYDDSNVILFSRAQLDRDNELMGDEMADYIYNVFYIDVLKTKMSRCRRRRRGIRERGYTIA